MYFRSVHGVSLPAPEDPCVLPAGFLCPCEATLARAVTLTSLSYIVFWSVTILVLEVLVR